MKKQFLFLVLSIVLLFSVQGQAPQKFNYQTIVRGSNGLPLANANVSMQFIVHDLTPNGNTVFQENASVTTNQFGLINYSIGSGGNLAG
ncbi:MAG: hypothetical protein IPP77_05340 [Bacteroidetes bacterium]|nr:hypothetical protein [Bacteroidota bacterium]